MLFGILFPRIFEISFVGVDFEYVDGAKSKSKEFNGNK